MLNIPERASKGEPHWQGLSPSWRTSQSAFEMSKHASATAGLWVKTTTWPRSAQFSTRKKQQQQQLDIIPQAPAFHNQLSFRADQLSRPSRRRVEVTDLTQALLFSCRLFEISHSRTHTHVCVSAAIFVWQALRSQPLISATSKDWFVR